MLKLIFHLWSLPLGKGISENGIINSTSYPKSVYLPKDLKSKLETRDQPEFCPEYAVASTLTPSAWLPYKLEVKPILFLASPYVSKWIFAKSSSNKDLLSLGWIDAITSSL